MRQISLSVSTVDKGDTFFGLRTGLNLTEDFSLDFRAVGFSANLAETDYQTSLAWRF